ncbi:TPA: hypothetical protein ACNHS6_002586 [Enterococcus faecalis]
MVKELKSTLRKELLTLMNEDEDWYRKKNTERYKQIQALGKKLERVSAIHSINRKEFEIYRSKGLQFKEIADRFNVNIKTLKKWREDNGYPIYHNKGSRRGLNKK